MRSFLAGALVLAAVSVPASAAHYEFAGTISTEFWNFNDTTGQELGLVRAGDTYKGFFNYNDSTPLAKSGNTAIGLDPVLASRLEVYRGGNLVVALEQGPAFFSDGNPVDQSQVFARNGDATGLRDTLTLSVGGTGGYDPADPTGTVVTPIRLTPAQPNIIIPGWTLIFREKCSSGAVGGGNCVSNSVSFDYYNGTQTTFDFAAAFANNSVAELNLTFQYAGTPGGFDGNFEQATGGLTQLNAVPEPSTWAMLIVGFGTIGGSLRTKRHRPARA